MTNKSIVEEKSFKFAVRIVKLYKHMGDSKKEFVLSKQLLRSGTSVGANVTEALQGQSKRDFLSKMNIALKEASETQYWLKLLHATEFLNDTEYDSINKDSLELVKLLTSIVKTTGSDLK